MSKPGILINRRAEEAKDADAAAIFAASAPKIAKDITDRMIDGFKEDAEGDAMGIALELLKSSKSFLFQQLPQVQKLDDGKGSIEAEALIEMEQRVKSLEVYDDYDSSDQKAISGN
jgi:hypothetical protein